MSLTIQANSAYTIDNFFNPNDSSPDFSSLPVSSASSTQLNISGTFSGSAFSIEAHGSFPSLGTSVKLGSYLASSATVSYLSLSVGSEGTITYNSDQPISFQLAISNLASGSASGLQQLFSGNDTFSGSLSTNNDYSNDHVFGYTGNDTFIGNSTSGPYADLFDGGSGIDTAVFRGNARSYNIYSEYRNIVTDDVTVVNGIARVVKDTQTGRDGEKDLVNVERLQFSDRKVAFDLSASEHAGQAMEFIGVIAPGYLSALPVRGAIISLFDQGQTMEGLCQLALDLNLIPKATNAQLANAVFSNVTGGGTPSQEMTNTLVGYINSHSQANFLATVASMHINVDLVGLQQTGLEYTL